MLWKNKVKSIWISGSWAGPVLFFLAGLGVLLLTAQITVYCDDYWYGIFFREGWEKFWELTVWHYQNFNGRAFVHLMAQLVLLFDTKLFVVLNPLMLSLVFLLGQRLQDKSSSWPTLLLTAGLGILSVLALPLEYLSTSILWISAAFNYLFPLCFLFLTFWLYRRDFPGPWAFAGLCLMSLLSGATTEQSGLAAVVCLGGWGLLGLLRKTLSPWRALLPGGLASLGYATIILAPGTWVRVGREIGGGVTRVFQGDELLFRFRLSMRFFTGSDGVPALFAAFALLWGLHWALCRQKRPLWGLLGPGAAVLYLLLLGSQHYFLAELFTVLCFTASAVFCLLSPETTVRGLLLSGMLAAQMVMLLNRSAAPRTAIPAILLLLTVCASLLAESLSAFLGLIPRLSAWVSPLLAVLGLFCLLPFFLPTFQGYAKNAPAFRDNERELRDRSDDVILLNADLDPRFAHYSYLFSDSYLQNAMDYYGVTDEKIQYTSSQGKVAGTYSFRAGLPVIEQDGKLCAALLGTVEMCGGEGHWEGKSSGTAVSLGDKSYLIQNNGRVFGWDPAAKQRLELLETVDIFIPYYTYYVPIDDLSRLFSISFSYHPEENIYYISTGNSESKEAIS
ncbi:hypothetical protein D7X94_02010 [Acutalibacter sp. 1XD8-33]|uniref:DUF6056 family protein n=1 Tax=Acutalibacter sp. 1XD8-33 TaxID=2320081 RepID=UPI000EA2508C|nr:DUF6056 family protein [Acutalibacter sp. 1XD8-33]RKJ41608.1 hypothetical protein D7X94_02010 [Acutalibacter sp. 1XD8-33]